MLLLEVKISLIERCFRNWWNSWYAFELSVQIASTISAVQKFAFDVSKWNCTYIRLKRMMCFHKWYGTWDWRVTWFLIVKVLLKSDTLLTMYMWLILNRRELVSVLQLMYWRLLRRTRMRQTIQYGRIWLLICLISVFSPSIPTSTIYSSSIKYNYSLMWLTGWDGINGM